MPGKRGIGYANPASAQLRAAKCLADGAERTDSEVTNGQSEAANGQRSRRTDYSLTSIGVTASMNNQQIAPRKYTAADT
jgi:hypothetical protein